MAGPPGRLDVTWQGRLDFDGLTARFVDQVVAKTDATTVQAGSLDVVFDKPFQFGTAPRGGPQPDVVRVACGSKVRIESRATQADGGKSIEQLFVRDLVVDRVTGDVTGTGPGRLTSTRLGQPAAMSLPAGPPGAAGVPAQPVAAPRRANQLNYLGVDFQRGMRGNLNRRVMEFHQRVEAIHGPVADWADTLDPHAPGGLAAGVVTRDLNRAHRVIHQLEAGICWINAWGESAAEMPVGGYKQSGVGRENGISSLNNFTRIKSVQVELGDYASVF